MLFQKDPELRERALGLYLALLKLIEGFVIELEKSIGQFYHQFQGRLLDSYKHLSSGQVEGCA